MADPFGFPLVRAARHGLSLRPATEADMPFLSALYATTRADELATTGWDASAKALFVVQQFAAQHRHYGQEFASAVRAIIVRDDAPIGRLYVDMQGRVCHLIDITLLPAACSQGLGSALLRDLQDFAGTSGRGVGLSVLRANRARHLYERMGFRRTGRGALYDTMTWPGARISSAKGKSR